MISRSFLKIWNYLEKIFTYFRKRFENSVLKWNIYFLWFSLQSISCCCYKYFLVYCTQGSLHFDEKWHNYIWIAKSFVKILLSAVVYNITMWEWTKDVIFFRRGTFHYSKNDIHLQLSIVKHQIWVQIQHNNCYMTSNRTLALKKFIDRYISKIQWSTVLFEFNVQMAIYFTKVDIISEYFCLKNKNFFWLIFLMYINLFYNCDIAWLRKKLGLEINWEIKLFRCFVTVLTLVWNSNVRRKIKIKVLYFKRPTDVLVQMNWQTEKGLIDGRSTFNQVSYS